MAGFGDYTGYNRPFGLDPNRETNDLYDTRYQQIYGYHTPVTEEYQGPPLVMDEASEDGWLQTFVFVYKTIFLMFLRCRYIKNLGLFSDNNTYVTTAISVASLVTENLLSHPFIVLRRQCQVGQNFKLCRVQQACLVLKD